MNTDKQIEEMAKAIYGLDHCEGYKDDRGCMYAPSCSVCKYGRENKAKQISELLAKQGYRKASDVAELEEKLADVTANWQKIHDAYDADCIEHYNKGRSAVAREIFEEIEKRLAMYSHIHKHAEEAKQITEEYANGDPVEMVSVWDACRLEHNGYDDYETMCQLQDNIGNIEKSRLLKEFEGDIAELKKKYTEEGK